MSQNVTSMRWSASARVGALARVAWLGITACVSTSAQAQQVPPGFGVTTVASGFVDPVGIAFSDDGRMFVTEKRGMVWVVENGVTLPEPFIDLRHEVNGPWDRGLLGLALDPDFLTNRRVYLLYTVDPIFGEPDESPFDGTFSRLTRYTGTVQSNGNVADMTSRLVLIGATAPQGIPVCDPSHTIGTLEFGLDGSLFVSAGDGAHFDQVDAGGLDSDCFGPGRFGRDEDIGAFRSQHLGSLAGKILRIEPATGLGLPTNPYWTGNGGDNKSRIWASGLRNPYRFSVRPDSPGPGTLYIGDVGWFTFEEINVACGGENFGWPCIEGSGLAPGYSKPTPAHSGCETIQTLTNPGPLTGPLITWHHGDPSQSWPPGCTGATAIGGVFDEGACYPPPYQGAYFFADYSAGWIKALQVDANDNFVALHDFATNAGNPVGLAAHPGTGYLHYVAIFAGEVRRIQIRADVNGDGVVNVLDLIDLLLCFGQPAEPGCEDEDVNGDGTVNVLDLLDLLLAFGTGCP